jgi:hypothetical protein
MRTPSDDANCPEFMTAPRTDILRQVDAARERISTCEGATLMSEVSAVARTYRVFAGNVRQFEGFLAHYDNNVTARLELWDVRNRKGFEAFLNEIDRLLHNYLAAATSLRDHSRRLWRKYPPPDPALTMEYDRLVKECFAESPLANFVQRLRNYSTHSKLPVARGQLTLSREEGDKSTVILSKSDLLAWPDWNSAARSFIESHDGENMDLRSIVSEYTTLVHEFNEWYGRAFVGGHLPAFDELARRQSDLAKLLHDAGLVPPADFFE